MLLSKLKVAILSIALLFGSYQFASSQETQLFLESRPSGANVLNTALEIIGKTPYDISKATYKKDTILIALKDHDTSRVSFIHYSGVKQFPAAAFLCEPCQIEMKPAIGKEEPSGILVLRKSRAFPEGDENKAFLTLVDPFHFNFSDTSVIGTIDGKKMKWGDKKIIELIDRKYHEYEPNLYGLNDSYFKTIVNRENTIKKYPYRFRIKAKFKNLAINFSDLNGIQMRGNSSFDSEWAIYNKLDSVTPIATFNFHSSLYRTKTKKTNILSSLIFDAERQLLSIDTLYDFLTRQDYLINILGVGKEIELTRPPHLTFANLKEINRHSSPNVIIVEGKSSFGSGFFISDKGYLVTNYHVIDNEDSIKIVINKNLKLNATVIKTNEDFDLALLKVDYDSLPGLWLADSDSVEYGDPVVAIGTPLDKMFSSTLTKGIVSGMRDFDGIHMIQTDVSINSGNSGGPLINEKGEVVGMSTMKIKAKGVEGIGFCIPSNDIIKKLNIVYK
ncbi:MAG: S1C family serine protease [Bacteroidota bacterium]